MSEPQSKPDRFYRRVPQDILRLSLTPLRERLSRLSAEQLVGPSPLMRRFRNTITNQFGRYYLHIQQGLRALSETLPDRAAEAPQVFASSMELNRHQILYDVALNRDTGTALASFSARSNLSTEAFRQLRDLRRSTGEPAGSAMEALL